jgi:hypothetical protein
MRYTLITFGRSEAILCTAIWARWNRQNDEEKVAAE